MKKEKKNVTEERELTLPWALFCLAFLLVTMILSVSKIVVVPIHITLLTSMAVTIAVVSIAGRQPWDKIASYIEYGGKIAMQPTLIMMIVGALIGSWVACGTVPMIIYWGLRIINPSIFLVTACLVCLITALSSGSSWSTAGTVGIALMGIGSGLGINPAMTAGAIVSGAYFGDKMSPMSDTTNLAPAVAEADLFDHIKSMMYTSFPAIGIALIVYAVLGFGYSAKSVDSASVKLTMDTLAATFDMNILILLPPVLVIIMAAKKCPAVPTLLVAVASAAVLAIAFQGQSISSITTIMDTGFVSETGVAEIDTLLTRGGLQSMLWTASLGMLGMLYGAVLEKSGLLKVFLKSLHVFTKTVGGLVCTVVVACFGLQAATASQTLTIVVGGRMFIDEYKKKNMLPQTLSRTLEDAGTLSSPLIPWSLCGVYMTGTLGVSTFDYLPFALFCWLCPIIAIIYGFTGKFQWKTGEKPSKRTYAPVQEISAE